MTSETSLPTLALLVPCFNEEEALPQCIKTLSGILSSLIEQERIKKHSYLLIVDDGSTDKSREIIQAAVNEAHGAVRGILLQTNVGQQTALMAGIDYLADKCDVAISLDADLQDDPVVIPRMLEKYEGGADIVYGVRKSRNSDNYFKRTSAHLYYRSMRILGARTIYDHSDFRLMSSRMLRSLGRYEERNLFLRGIVPLLGGKEEYVEYDRKPRKSGKTKYPLSKMFNFAADGITSFSMRPVRWVSLIGLIFMLSALVMFVYAIIRHLGGNTIEGWTSLVLSIWFCSGVILMSLGIIGEYIGKIYLEVKHRPRYHIHETLE